ncbi:YceD family protein [Candidatus Williamhamiltonella defendens]|uniref:YceD family protein n=1 Tax=Candidatus Williamhamiltonella defendens TaxID=138072 RepID=UPI00130D6BC3|nr:YceD family protein [Candidatus Hamiltonella defensa]
MRKIKLPLTIDPIFAANKGLEYMGFCASDQFMRIAESVDSIESDIDVFLLFKIDEKQRAFIKGHAHVDSKLTCQRCCSTFLYHLKTEYYFIPVTSGTYDNLSETYRGLYDYIEMNEAGELNLVSMIEDELILSIPAFPVHEDNDCHLFFPKMGKGIIQEQAKKFHPFSVLSRLKKK